MGYVDATGNCVCPMPGHAGSPRASSTAKPKAPVRRRKATKKMTEKAVTVKVRKQKVRRQNRKRPAATKRLARGTANGCL